MASVARGTQWVKDQTGPLGQRLPTVDPKYLEASWPYYTCTTPAGPISVSKFVSTWTSFVGANYGTIVANLPSLVDAVSLMKANGITAVRLFEPNRDIYEALRGAGIKVSVGVLNDDLLGLALAGVSTTSGWLETHILPFSSRFLRLHHISKQSNPRTKSSVCLHCHPKHVDITRNR
ncbi:hypothetical protein Scep_009512 [Stephania cephalantha]|uniref:Uncharacterized protein n=1 Tax=Stephania cephalantha TaxID=152367 RepID=A0AAP0JTT6_9MAGN